VKLAAVKTEVARRRKRQAEAEVRNRNVHLGRNFRWDFELQFRIRFRSRHFGRNFRRNFELGFRFCFLSRESRDWSPEHPAGLGAGVSISISIEGIEGLESFYEVILWSRGRARSVTEPSGTILVGAVFVLEKAEDSRGGALPWRR
jgi:hypothetical protein